ncbi:MAG: hypothetical protein AB7P23_04790 [Amphiplicatus sp.]
MVTPIAIVLAGFIAVTVVLVGTYLLQCGVGRLARAARTARSDAGDRAR